MNKVHSVVLLTLLCAWAICILPPLISKSLAWRYFIMIFFRYIMKINVCWGWLFISSYTSSNMKFLIRLYEKHFDELTVQLICIVINRRITWRFWTGVSTWIRDLFERTLCLVGNDIFTTILLQGISLYDSSLIWVQTPLVSSIVHNYFIGIRQ